MNLPFLVHDYLRRSAILAPQKTALICGRQRWSYQALDLASDSLARALEHQGLQHQDRVVVFFDNSPEAVIAIYAVMKTGAIAVPVHSLVKPKKLAYILRDCGAKILITGSEKAQVVSASVENLESRPGLIWVGDPTQIPAGYESHCLLWDEIQAAAGSQAGTDPERKTAIDQDLALILYTSGSTGEPKGVMAPHLSVLSAARSIIQYLDNRPSDIIVNVLPLSFDYGLYQVIMAFMFGGSVVLIPSFCYPVKVLEAIEQERVTGFPIVPTMAALLSKLRNWERFDLSSVRYLTNTAAPLSTAHIRKLRKCFPSAKLYSMYGLTECKRVSYLPPEEIDKRPTSVGIPMPNCRVTIVDDNGNELPHGMVGELVVTGTHVMRGYWNSPELTLKTFQPGRYPGETMLHTGDLFHKDTAGYLYFVGRKDDLIKTKGERVSPLEIEQAIQELPGVDEVAVLGVEDDILGQAVVAVIVKDPEHDLDAPMVRKHCAATLEPFMIPKEVYFVQSLPKTARGKADKDSLLAWVREQLSI